MTSQSPLRTPPGTRRAGRPTTLTRLTGAAATLLALATVSGPLADAAAAQPAPAGAAPAAQQVTTRGWVTGTVVDGKGRPVEGALVSALTPVEVPEAGALPDVTDRRDWTDVDGHFRVRQAGPAYLVQVCSPEPGAKYACKETARGVPFLITYVGPAGVTDSWVTQTGLFHAAAADRDLGTVRVKPQSWIGGHLVNGAFAELQVQRLNGTAAFRTTADADGDYQFQGLAPGRYRIAAGGNGTGFLPFLSDVVSVQAREHAVVDGRLRRGASIGGVLTSHGKPVPFTDVLVRRNGSFVAAATTNRRGHYLARGLTPGTYRVGILYDGSDYQRKGVTVTVTDPTASVDAPITVRRGARITVTLRVSGKPAVRARDELRDDKGRPVLGARNFNGEATYTGLRPGTYTVVAASKDRWRRTTITVRSGRSYDLGVLRLDRPTLTLTGTTAPHAVVEAYSGSMCPPDAPYRPGSFHRLEVADASGRYTITGLVPGRWMLGSDGWPQNYAPRCVDDVRILKDRTYDLPLATGGEVHGRLVYASTATPVTTHLSYQLSYPAGLATNPTGEHPARSQVKAPTGTFTIQGLPAGTPTGALAREADLDQITDPSYFVIYPFQDGTPYYLTSDRMPVTVTAGGSQDLGDIPLTLHG